MRGHSFMTPTQKGRASGVGWGVSSIWTSTKIFLEPKDVIHPVFFSCKEMAFFVPEFRLWMEQKWKFFSYNLVI